jgi:hypothetical protein
MHPETNIDNTSAGDLRIAPIEINNAAVIPNNEGIGDAAATQSATGPINV